MKKEDLNRIFLPTSSKIIRVEKQIAQFYTMLRKEVSTYAKNHQHKLQVLEDQISVLENKLRHIDSRNIELQALQILTQRHRRELNLLKHSYEVFSQRLEESRLQAESADSNFFSLSVIQNPRTSTSPVFPVKNKLISIGIIAGLLTGVFINK